MNIRRNRLHYFILTIIIVILGLLSRRYAVHLPKLVNTYLGDALWAIMIYGMCCVLFPGWRALRTALASLLFCYCIEISQLYHAPWIDSLRHTRLGGLILGFGFLRSDIVAYSMGVVIAWLLDATCIERKRM